MSDPVIAQKGSFAVEVEEGKSYSWCACGRSQNQPFCDGSHKGSEFSPIRYTATSSGRRFFCGCKHSEKKPFCDGTHKTL